MMIPGLSSREIFIRDIRCHGYSAVHFVVNKDYYSRIAMLRIHYIQALLASSPEITTVPRLRV